MAIISNINGKLTVSDQGQVSFNRIGTSTTTGYTFPALDGNPNQILKTNGDGILSFVDDENSGGTVTGTGTENKVVRWNATAGEIGNGPILFSSSAATANSTFGGNIGLGMTPDTSWGTNSHIINIGIANADAGHIGWLEQAGADILTVGWNVYHNNTDWYYASNNPANLYTQGNGTHVFQVAASGTADNTITWTNALSIDSDGDSTFAGSATFGDAVRINATTTTGLVIASSPTASNGLKLYNNSTTDNAYIYNHFSGKLEIGTSNATVLTMNGTTSTFAGNVKLLGVLELNDLAQSIDFLQSGAINFDSNNDQTGRVLTIGSGRTGGSGGTTNVTFSEDGNSAFEGKVRVNNWIQGAQGTNTLYSTNSTGVLLQTSGNTAANDDSKIRFRNSNAAAASHTFDCNNGDAIFAGNVGVAGKTPAFGLSLGQGTGAGNKIAWTDVTPNFAASIYASSSTDKLTFATKNASNAETTALEIDTSQNATFAGNITFGDSHFIGDDASDNLLIQSSTGENIIIDSLDDILFRNSGVTQLQIKDTGSTFTGNIILNNNKQLQSKDTSGNARTIMYLDNGDTLVIGNPTTVDDIRFDVDNKGEGAMIIKSSGNVGIGVTGPAARLNVVGVGQANNPTVAIDVTNNDSFNHGLEIFDANLATGQTVLMAIGQSGSTKLTAIFGFVRNENSLDQNLATIGFWGADNKLTVSAAGNVGIGTGTDAPSTKLQVVGTGTQASFQTSASYSDIKFVNSTHTNFLNFSGATFIVYQGGGSGSNVTFAVDSGGTATFKADVVAFGNPSDKRLKENIKPIDSALDKVIKLQGVTFDWKEKAKDLDKEGNPIDLQQWKHDIGFIAQDVKKIIPELVRENENGMLSMRHQGIAPILLEAIKELKAEIDELKKCNCDCKK